MDRMNTGFVPDLSGGPANKRGSSVGDAGGAGWVRSSSGGSSLITSFNCFAGRLAGCFRLFPLAPIGVPMTSRGGVNLSRGGSYGGIGVIERLFLAEITFRDCDGEGGIKSACGLAVCGDRNKLGFEGEPDWRLLEPDGGEICIEKVALVGDSGASSTTPRFGCLRSLGLGVAGAFFDA